MNLKITVQETSSILTFTSEGFQKNRETKGQRSYFEVIITENVPNLGKKTDIQVQKAQNSGKKASTSINGTFIQHSTGSPSHNNQRGKRNKRYPIGKEDIKLSQFADDMVVLSCSVVSDSLQPHGLQPIRLLCLWNFFRQEYWSRFPFPTPGDLPNSDTSLASPAQAGRFFTIVPPWEASQKILKMLPENCKISSMNAVKLQDTKLMHKNHFHSYILKTKYIRKRN